MSWPLGRLLEGVGSAVVNGHQNATVTEVRDDSRQVEPGDLFVAAPGASVDGRRFVADALARGARVIVTEGDVDVAGPHTTVRVPSSRAALAVIAKNRYGAADQLTLFAVTGTNGKTTTTYLLEAILAAAGRRPGVIGTVAYRWAGQARPATLTTPGALELHRTLAAMRADGVTDVVLEASSHALHQHRLDGCRFRVGLLTNITQDHLDYHGTMDAYFEAKAILFERLIDPAAGAAVFFCDREDGRRMSQRARAAGVRVIGAAVQGPADVAVEGAELGVAGLRARVRTPAGLVEVTSRLVGDYNLRNVLGAVAVGVAAGIAPEQIARGVADLVGVPGRLETVPNDRQVLCVVDYAHTPDALERAMAALRPLTSGRLIVVFGCGGDRDRGKRALMGAAAARDADIAVVTSDNPRTEEPGSIVSMILEGVRRHAKAELAPADLREAERGTLVEVDRARAIALAVGAARPGDSVLIAGKGHEDYQIIGTNKIAFDDREQAAAAFASAGARP